MGVFLLVSLLFVSGMRVQVNMVQRAKKMMTRDHHHDARADSSLPSMRFDSQEQATHKQQKVIVVGAGHNGLIAACYLARTGREVLVLEQSTEPGGGSRTEERIPGYRFDMHTVAHNMLNMTTIGEELDLAGVGLDYIEMDPFAVALRADGRRVRFYRSIEATVASIAESDREEADAYAAFMEVALPEIVSIESSFILSGRIRRGERDCQAIGREVRIIHHCESLYPS
jgi:putative NAD(P)-binding protein